LFALVLLDCVRARMQFRHAHLCKAVVIVALFMTLSLTGIALMAVYLVVKSRSLVFRGLAVAVALLTIDFIVFNESEFISKAGSLDMRLEHLALIETLISSWENILFGIGFGNEALISEMRVNNFVPELIMYSSVFGLFAVLVLLALAMRRGRKTNHILLMVLLYSLSTPMLWSPLFVLAVFVSWRLPRATLESPPPGAPAAA
jgi:predicted membrane protein